MPHGRTLRSCLALASIALLLPLLLACGPRPTIVAPADSSQLDPTGITPVEIDFGHVVRRGTRIDIRLVTGLGESPSIVDVTDRFLPAAGDFVGESGASGELTSADGLVPGRGQLVVSVVRERWRPILRHEVARFSWEPDVDLAHADRCDFLDGRHCLLPFPSDFFTTGDQTTDTGLRIDLALESMPASNSGVHVDPTELNRNDGFSPGQMILTHVPGIDLDATGAPRITDLEASLEPDSPFVIVNAQTLEHHLHWAELDSQASDPSEQALILRPGVNFESGGHYIVALRGVRDAAGELIEAPRAFRLYRDRIRTYQPEIESRRAHMEEILATLQAAGVERSDLHLAWDFTVISKRNVSERMVHMRDDAFARLGNAAPAFTVDTVNENPADPEILRRIDGTFQVPLYVDNGGASPARLVLSADGLPVYQGADYTAKYRCVVPRSASEDGGDPVTPARISLYGHGLLGSREETSASHVRAMAFEHNMIFCGTDWIGMASDDLLPSVVPILQDFSRFPQVPDRMHQGMLDFLFLGRLMKHPDGFSSHPAFQAGAAGTPLIDGRDLFYDGNSQGAIAGGALAAFAQDFDRAVLGVPGMNYSTLLRRSVDFTAFLQILSSTYSGELNHTLGVAMIQMLWDRTEANGHANHLTTNTYPGTPAKKILLHVAFGDYQVANISAEVEARTIGAHVHQPALAPGLHWEQTPFFGIPAIPSDPFDGSALVYWDSGNPAPPNDNQTPGALSGMESACALAHGGDPHECPRRQPSARLQKSEFLRTGGAVVDVCGGMPCLAEDP